MGGEMILLVDDQEEIREPVRRRLEVEGYRVRTASDGMEALEAFAVARPAAVVLDVSMPRLDGLAVCRRIRAESSVPILMLSAKAEESDMIVGLELGADDYLTKPFKLNVLLARIRALLRRAVPEPSRSPEGEGQPRAGRLVLDTKSCEARLGGQPVALTPVEFRLLSALLKEPGQVLSRETLLQQVWGYEGYDVGLVNTHVKRLRAKVETDPANPELIVTVRGFGYKIVP
jgi:two-component system response regulator MtrA